jgi:hypothetical protein
MDDTVTRASPSDDNTPRQGVNGHDSVMLEAKRRFKWCAEWEGDFRPRFIEDVKFANGDSDNGYQWPNEVRRNRDVDARPCLTMNLIRQHNKNISNEARKNKASVKVVGTGNGATEQSAAAYRDIIRHVEMISKAQNAYTIARGWQIDGGIGWWRLTTDYAAPDTFDQEIYVKPVNDPLSVYMDPDIQQPDGSDARFAFVFDDVPRDEFDEAYPELAGQMLGENPMGLGSSDDDWVNRRSVRVCEYFRKTMIPDQVVSFMYQNKRHTLLASKMPENVLRDVLALPLTKTRPTHTEVVEWFLIVGEQVIDSTTWMGKYIPLVRIIGEETVIEGILDRKGHTRNMKDAQRMFNYNASAQVEFVALQSKTPWLAPSAAIEEYETMWNSANVVNHSVLVYNAFDDDGNPLPTPIRQDPPQAAPAFQVGMDTAFNQIMMVSGQWQNQMGMAGNERTGRAIDLRQQQSATSTFHFQDNYETGLLFTATILIDLVPKIYDTKRVLSILADDDTTFELEIDPGAQQAFAQQQAVNGQIVRRIFNPMIGRYAVAPSVGAAYGTKREEARDALSILLTQAKDLVPIVGDLLLADMDFEGAQEAARRLKRMVPPQALGRGPTQNETVLQGQVQALAQALSEALQDNAKLDLKLVGKNQLRDTQAYAEETKRIGVLKDYLPTEPEALRKLLLDVIADGLETDLSPIINANANDLDLDSQGAKRGLSPGLESGPESESAMPSGAKKAADGNWYLDDPARPGKYLRVERK